MWTSWMMAENYTKLNTTRLTLNMYINVVMIFNLAQLSEKMNFFFLVRILKFENVYRMLIIILFIKPDALDLRSLSRKKVFVVTRDLGLCSLTRRTAFVLLSFTTSKRHWSRDSIVKQILTELLNWKEHTYYCEINRTFNSFCGKL